MTFKAAIRAGALKSIGTGRGGASICRKPRKAPRSRRPKARGAIC